MFDSSTTYLLESLSLLAFLVFGGEIFMELGLARADGHLAVVPPFLKRRLTTSTRERITLSNESRLLSHALSAPMRQLRLYGMSDRFSSAHHEEPFMLASGKR